MKRTAAFLLSVMFVFGFLAGIAQAADKFAYIELRRVFDEYSKTKDYDKVLEQKENVYSGERDKKVNEIKQLQDKIGLLSDKEKDTKSGDLQTKIKSLQETDRQKLADLRKESNEKRVEIMKDIEAAIKTYSEKEGYTFVFNEVGVLYNIKSTDITDKVLDVLNKGYKK